MTEVVLDASALLALIREEPGAGRVKEAFPSVAISTVNLSEVAAFMAQRGMPIAEVRSYLHDLPMRSVSFDDDFAFAAAALRPETRAAGLSLGDRACLALARQLNRPVLTADRAWAGLSAGVEVRLIRQGPPPSDRPV